MEQSDDNDATQVLVRYWASSIVKYKRREHCFLHHSSKHKSPRIHWFLEGILMAVKQEKSSTLSDYSSVEDVISEWKKRISDDWVKDILARPETSSNVRLLGERLDMNEVEAWTTYFSGMLASQI